MDCIEGREMVVVLANRVLEVVRESGASKAEIHAALDSVKSLISCLDISLVPSRPDAPSSLER